MVIYGGSDFRGILPQGGSVLSICFPWLKNICEMFVTDGRAILPHLSARVTLMNTPTRIVVTGPDQEDVLHDRDQARRPDTERC